MYQTIMLTLDGSTFADAAVEQAREVASASGSHVVLLDVTPEHRGPFPFTAEVARNTERREAVEHLQQVRDRLLASGVSNVEIVTVRGDSPGPAIVDAARRLRCDAVVMATHDRTGLRRLISGSVAQHVIRHLKGTDVLLVRPAAKA